MQNFQVPKRRGRVNIAEHFEVPNPDPTLRALFPEHTAPTQHLMDPGTSVFLSHPHTLSLRCKWEVGG